MRATLIATIAFLFAATLPAQLDVPPPQQLVKLSGAVQQRNGGEVHGVITAIIDSGWHINSAHPIDTFSIPTALSLDPATADAVRVDYPQHTLRTFTFAGGGKLAVYEGTIQIPFTAKLKSGASSIRASLHYQACNDTICLPPRDVTADVTLSGAAASQAAGFTPLTAAPKDRAITGTDALSSTFASHGLPLTLLILFVGGLALNLTPCVFPMIPITVGFFSLQSDGRRSRRLALSSLYVLGLVIMYSALGVIAALSGKMFGGWLQHPAVLIGFAMLMVILSTSMFGLWDITVPQFIANRSGGRAGLAGALTMGVFVGIVAAPCVGPVVVALFTLVAAIGKPLIGFVMFGALALGLGFPYLIMLNALPKPGEWMVQVKKAMGFVLMAMAVYFLRPLIGENAFRWGVAASLLIGAAFLFFSRSVGPRGGRVMRLACASLLLIAGAAFAIPRPSGANVQWQRYDARIIAGTGKPVIIDFYADWCIPCKELDEKTFGDRQIAAELDRFTRVKADLTNDKDPAVQKLTKEYQIVGVPTIVFLDSTGHELAEHRLTGFEGPQQFVARLKQVR